MSSEIIMYLGFALAAYSVIGNDVIQTLGTFLSSNEKRPWYVLWAFAGSILLITLVYGWYNNHPQRLIHIDGYCEIKTDNQELHGLYLSFKQLTQKDATGKTSAPKFLSEPEKADKDEAVTLMLNVYKRAILPTQLSQYTALSDTIKATASQPMRLDLEFKGQTIHVELPSEQIRDVSYGRLDQYSFPSRMSWWYLLPPLVLLFLTRWGIPVSTTFLILTFFNPKNLGNMAFKSGLGYLIAFGIAILFYGLIASQFEKHFLKKRLEGSSKKRWTAFQWTSTGFLWTQWLIQDFANIYVYLPRQVSLFELLATAVGMLVFLAYIFYSRGGVIQRIVKVKTNTADIRSATFIDLMFGVLLLCFKEMNKIPMSTTWVFLGLLAGREYVLRLKFQGKTIDNGLQEESEGTRASVGLLSAVHVMVLKDLAKALLGLAVSIGLVYLIKFISSI